MITEYMYFSVLRALVLTNSYSFPHSHFLLRAIVTILPPSLAPSLYFLFTACIHHAQPSPLHPGITAIKP